MVTLEEYIEEINVDSVALALMDSSYERERFGLTLTQSLTMRPPSHESFIISPFLFFFST